MNEEHHITITKMTVGVGTGAGGAAAKALAEGYHLPSTGEMIGYLTIFLLLMQIVFLLADRYQKYRGPK